MLAIVSERLAGMALPAAGSARRQARVFENQKRAKLSIHHHLPYSHTMSAHVRIWQFDPVIHPFARRVHLIPQPGTTMTVTASNDFQDVTTMYEVA